MKNIGEILKKRRLELGYSLEEIHTKTKLSIVYLKAIEEGDLEYFRHELSYLKFFLQYYCQTVGLDYNLIKDEYEKVVEQYTETQVMKKMEQKQQSNENIRQRVQYHKGKYQKPVHKERLKYKKLDGQTIVRIFIALILVAVLVWGLMFFIKQRFNSQSTSTTLPSDVTIPEPIVKQSEVQTEQNTPTIEVSQSKPEVKTPLITPMRIEGNLAFTLSNLDYKLENKLKIKLKHETWISFMINGNTVNQPTTTIYPEGSEIEILLDASYEFITLELGLVGENQFYLNDQLIDTQELVSEVNGYDLVFYIQGE